MQRFFFENLPLWKDITISEIPFVHQVWRVLRSEIGESVVLFNGDGFEYIYVIQKITKKEIELSFLEKHRNSTGASSVYVTLYQALPNKYEKIEHILQKWTEVWIQKFVFFRSERSQNLVINDRKKERFTEIVKEATEQSYGNVVPSIVFLNSIPSDIKDGISCIFHTDKSDSESLSTIGREKWTYNIFVGPEGGWSKKELDYFKWKNLRKIYLWNRILRTETTGIVVAFFLQQI